MAIKRLQQKDGTIYYAVECRYPRNRDGQRRRETAGTRDEADALWGKILKELRADRDPRMALGKTDTFEEHAREVLEKHYKAKRWYPWAKIVIEKHLIPYFGKLPLGKVTVKRITDYMHGREAQGRKAATVMNERAVLSKILSLGVDWDRLLPDAIPMRKVKKLEVLNRRDRWLTPDEQRALISAASGHVRDAIILALGTGGRHSEVVMLRWDAVYIERGEVTFRADSSKSGRARTLPVNEAVLSMLKARRDDPHRPRFGPGKDFVFTYQGRPVKSIRAGFRSACESAGLGRDVTVHTLRHTFCTRFGHSGGNIRDLQALAGHSAITTTQRYYHRSDSAARIIDAMADDLTVPVTSS